MRGHQIIVFLLLFLICIGVAYKYNATRYISNHVVYIFGVLIVSLWFTEVLKPSESFQMVLNSPSTDYRTLVDDIIFLRKPEYVYNMAADMKNAQQGGAFYTAVQSLQTLFRALYNAKTKESWRRFVDLCLWLMNYNSVLFPTETKAKSVASLATPADRRKNFAELLKQSEYSYINVVEPRYFGEYMASGLAIDTASTTIKPGLNSISFDTMWGFLFHLSTQTQMFLMCIRVNSPESDTVLHKDIDDVFKWFEKVAYFLHQSIPLDNNIGFSQLINITMACLMNCRDLKTIGARAEAFIRYNINYEEAPNPNPFSTTTYNYIPPFEIIPDHTKKSIKQPITDADREILYGYIWSESWREYKILNYQMLYMKVLWPFMLIMQETKTPFNKAAFGANLEKVVRNTSADLILEKAYKAKGLTLVQFSQIMKNYLTQNGDKVIRLEDLLAEIEKGAVQVSTECLAPSATEMKTKTLPVEGTVSLICSTFMNANECAFNPINVKLMMYYSVCGKLAKYGRVVKKDQCIWASSGGTQTDQNWYNYFFKGVGMPGTFGTLYMTDLTSKDFVDALKLWVGTEKSVFPTS